MEKSLFRKEKWVGVSLLGGGDRPVEKIKETGGGCGGGSVGGPFYHHEGILPQSGFIVKRKNQKIQTERKRRIGPA